ncbi:MAG: Flagellar basal body rod protein FlgB [Planctomycetota bacterium]
MWSSLLGQSSINALTQTLQFTEKRHELISSNVANMDTPNYKTRDLDVDRFQNSLRQAIEEPAKTRTRSPGERSPGEITALDEVSDQWQKTRDVSKQVLFHDGHDISLEEQVTEAAKNQTMHFTAVALLKAQFRTMQMAITENVNV